MTNNINMIFLENEQLRDDILTYKEDLQTNYYIVKREKPEGFNKDYANTNMQQFYLYKRETPICHLDVTIFPDLGFMEFSFLDSEAVCGMYIHPSMSTEAFETFSLDEIEKMMYHIQLTRPKLLTKGTDPVIPEFDSGTVGSFFKEYLQVLTAVQYTIVAIRTFESE